MPAASARRRAAASEDPAAEPLLVPPQKPGVAADNQQQSDQLQPRPDGPSSPSQPRQDLRAGWSYEFHDDIEPTVAFFYTPRTISILVVLLACVLYAALFVAGDDVVANTKMGIAAAFVFILVTGLLEFKDGPFIRDKHTMRELLKYVDSSLGVPLPEKSYAEDCSITYKTVWDQMDVFVLAHTFGWYAKALVLRDYWFCWILSIMFEVMEYSLEHQLPNFAECWWDHVRKCKKLGMHAWMCTANVFTEALICLKYGQGEFPNPAPTEVVIFWGVFLTGLVVYPIVQFWILAPGRGAAARKSVPFAYQKTVKAAKGVKGPKAKKAAPVKYTIDCSIPAGDNILDTAAFEKYLLDHLKVQGRTNNLGTAVTISRAGHVLTINAPSGTFPKRYFKYLSKRFLKKNQVRDWLRVIATSRTAYELRYPQINNADDDDEEEGDE
ncbi:hypothetical protein HK405_011678 [Cladochytrium tenue]|nr:hypothetical protein HK405_011678 [Cladochytrium tenue]